MVLLRGIQTGCENACSLVLLLSGLSGGHVTKTNAECNSKPRYLSKREYNTASGEIGQR